MVVGLEIHAKMNWMRARSLSWILLPRSFICALSYFIFLSMSLGGDIVCLALYIRLIGL